MEFCELDPHELKIDKTNERRSNPGAKTKGGDLEKSIAQNGVQFPIFVREKEGGLRVVAGQRRTLAAQAVDEDTIPAIKMELDDPEARALSMMENDEQLRKDVPRKDRARATRAYVKSLGSKSKAAENLGVTEQTIENRLETTRSFWKGTEFDADTRSEKGTDEIPTQLLARIRSITNSGEDAEDIAMNIKQEKIPRNIVDSALSNSGSRTEFERELERLYYRDEEDELELDIEVEFEGVNAQTLANYAKHIGTTPNDAARRIVEDSLNAFTEHQPKPDELRELDEFGSGC